MEKKFLASKVLFGISLCLLLLITVFFTILFIDAKKDDITNGNQLATGISAAIFIIYGAIGYGVITIINIVSYIFLRVSKRYLHKRMYNILSIVYIFVPGLMYGIILGFLLIGL